MKTNVRTLLREFPRVKEAALKGERITIETKEGNLLLVAETAPSHRLYGMLRKKMRSCGLTEEDAGLQPEDWDASI